MCFDLPALCVIQFQGGDAVAFLHAQVTNDVDHLSPDRACLAAYCTAKGRTLATMVLWRPQDDTVLALVRRDLADGLAKRLRMFVLRSKVAITLTELQVQGVTVDPAQGAAWEALGTAIQILFPDVIAVPCLVEHTTDARCYEELGGNIYRFSPFRTAEGEGLITINERISLENLELGIQFYQQMLQA